MPQSIIRDKQRLSYMSDEEFAKQYAVTDDDRLRDMAWGHGYGKNSLVYVNKKIRGQNNYSPPPIIRTPIIK